MGWGYGFDETGSIMGLRSSKAIPVYNA